MSKCSYRVITELKCKGEQVTVLELRLLADAWALEKHEPFFLLK